METGVLERIRGFEADIEKSVESIVQQSLFSADVANERHHILLDHFTCQQLAGIHSLADKLLDAYLDEDEVVAAQNAPTEGKAAIAAAVKQFEGRVADIREYHHTYRDLPPVRNQLAMPDAKLLETLFSVNERYGTCLDLEVHYNRYSTFMASTSATFGAVIEPLKGIDGVSHGEGEEAEAEDATAKRMRGWASAWPSRSEYFRFIPELPEIVVGGVDATRKLAGFAMYAEFVTELLAYLTDFYHRTHPLNKEDVPRLLKDAENDVEEFWAALAAVGTVSDSALTVVSEVYGSKGKKTGKAGVSRKYNGEKEENEEEEEHSQRSNVKLPHGTKVSCGLAVPPSLKKYLKLFSMWPLDVVNELVGYRSSVLLSQAAGPTTTTTANSTIATDKTRIAVAEQLPESTAAVKAVCVVEAQVSSLLQSLLFDVLQHTEKTVLRDYSRTTEELETDRAKADAEFAESLELVRRNSSNSLEGTAMSYAMAKQSLAIAAAAAARARGGHLGGPQTGRTAAGAGSGSSSAIMASGTGHGHARTTAAVAETLVNEKFVGEDGTSIPHWLVQLQQLEKAIVCEVCGGTVYQGPQVFRQHFGQERHTEGLRRLGIPQNLHEYEGIATIRGAIEMRDRLGNASDGFRKRLRENKECEELQDGQGQVMTNKQYSHLQHRRFI